MSSDEIQIDDIFQKLDDKKIRKKRINSKRKGNSSELKICKILSERFNKSFSRSPNSGAFGSTHNLDKDTQFLLSGDVLSPKNFYFTIENKAGYKIEILNLFKEKHTHKNTIYSFLDQGSKDAIKANKIPLIIYTKDRCQTICFVPLTNHKKYIKINDYIKNINHMIISHNGKNKNWPLWSILSLEDLLKMEDNFFFD